MEPKSNSVGSWKNFKGGYQGVIYLQDCKAGSADSGMDLVVVTGSGCRIMMGGCAGSGFMVDIGLLENPW